MTTKVELPQIILETANFHGGDVNQLTTAVDNFALLDYPNLAIKFHAFHPDNVALPDFSWYPTVKNFYIAENHWANLITQSIEKKFRVWLDLFCVYGVEILKQNLDNICGIKFQPSILDNLEIVDALKSLDLREKELIINISGLEVQKIKDYIQGFKSYNFNRIILQLGFQNFPTRVEDSSLKKIDRLLDLFPLSPISYADHIGAEIPISKTFPVYAYLKGCCYLEKHICNNRAETKYDADSALEYGEVKEITEELNRVVLCFGEEFISENEKKYYSKSLQKPVVREGLKKGQLASSADILFRRTDKPGVNHNELKDLQSKHFVLNQSLARYDTFQAHHFKRARIAVIVAARMKSSRLKRKAILPIQGMSSIERCLDNCSRFPCTDEVILATSTSKEDAVLSQHTLKGRVRFWQGDPEDVISRYLGACEEYNIDVIYRVTGDCPVVSPEIAGFLLSAHFSAGADFTESRQFAVGSNCQVYNVEALKRVIQLVGKADYSEHMTLYMTNNPDIFKVNIVDLPPQLIREYRLTLDYQEDLDMFNELFKKLGEENLESTLLNVFKILDNHSDIPKINAHKTLVYKTDPELIKLLNEKTGIKLKT